MTHPYIGRLAPSPSGLLHLGHAATIWQAFFRARDHNGALLFRNEDLNPQRSKPEYVEAMIEALAWLGIRRQGLSPAEVLQMATARMTTVTSNS